MLLSNSVISAVVICFSILTKQTFSEESRAYSRKDFFPSVTKPISTKTNTSVNQKPPPRSQDIQTDKTENKAKNSEELRSRSFAKRNTKADDRFLKWLNYDAWAYNMNLPTTSTETIVYTKPPIKKQTFGLGVLNIEPYSPPDDGNKIKTQFRFTERMVPQIKVLGSNKTELMKSVLSIMRRNAEMNYLTPPPRRYKRGIIDEIYNYFARVIGDINRFL